MNGDDLDLNRPDDSMLSMPPDRSRRTTWIVVAALVVAVLVGGAIRWWTQQREASETQSSAPATAASTPAPPEAPAVVLPPMDQMDAFLRVLLGTLSSSPELTAWLATDGLLQQLVVGIDRVAQGGTPAPDLKVLAPKESLTTAGRGRTRTIDPASYRRYDGIAEAVASVDPAAVARAYRTVKPRLDEAYSMQGKGANVDSALASALDLLIATPIPEGPVALVEAKGAMWAFADPTLEALSPAQKQLIRMGPENARRVQDSLRQIRQALQLTQG
jgi:hypothetical protein